MKIWLLRTLLIGFTAIAITLLLPRERVAARPPGQPPIPHSIADHADCVSCHATGAGGAPKYPADHAGRTNEMCLLCHKQGKVAPATATVSATATLTPLPTPTLPTGATLSPQPTATSSPEPTATPSPQPTAAPPLTPPWIPHPLQGRDNCLACHQSGSGGAPVLPASHAGRTVDTCRTCHQPVPEEAPPIVPTPVIHTQAAANQNSCVDCHSQQGGQSAQMVKDWTSSIHAERGVSCADCHGGDPTAPKKEGAMSAKAGYIGKPKTVDVPALCASCHANVETMRQYDLPTDQWAKYQQSVHGKKLAQGDTNVATCFVCHDGHATKAVTDPAAKVYALNVPALCANCHSNAELMKPYNLPTNQYVWDTTTIGDGAYDLRLLVADASGQYVTTQVSVKVDNATAAKLAAMPRRGCGACHVQIAPDGRYTLAFEAEERAKARGGEHPKLPNGFNTKFSECMACHGSKEDESDKGIGAPFSMRAIVHPAHMFSTTFKEHYGGNCFTCHDVDGKGEFKVLADKLMVNEKGVPAEEPK